MRRHILSLLAVLLFLCGLPVTAMAHAVPEEGRKGSITVTMKSGDKAVPGGTLTIYQVGSVHEDDGNNSFVPTGKFTAWGSDFGDISSAEQSAKTAESLASFVSRNGKTITGKTETIDNSGKVTFSDLEQGLYLLIQAKAADGYNKVSPFLVSIPYLDNGKYLYDLTAQAKTGLEQTPTPTTTTPSKSPSTPSAKLPQTGQLNWPIPVMVISGMTLFVIGWMLRFRKRDDHAQ